MKISTMLFLVIFPCLCMIVTGCEFLEDEIRNNPDGSQTITYKGEKYLLVTKNAIDNVSNTGMPLISVGTSALSGMLIIAMGVLGKIAANKRNIAKASVLAIESFSSQYNKTKDQIINMLKEIPDNEENKNAIKMEFSSLSPIKEQVRLTSQDMKNEKQLDRFVQKVTKKDNEEQKGVENG